MSTGKFKVRYRIETQARGHIYDVVNPTTGAIVGDGFPYHEAVRRATDLTVWTGDLFDDYRHDELNLTVESIGEIGLPDGRDQYVLVINKDDDLTPEQAQQWLRPKVYRDTNQAGGYYCHTVLAIQAQNTTNKVICTIEHRYDV